MGPFPPWCMTFHTNFSSAAQGTTFSPQSSTFNAFLFHPNFKSHLMDEQDGQEIVSPCC